MPASSSVNERPRQRIVAGDPFCPVGVGFLIAILNDYFTGKGGGLTLKKSEKMIKTMAASVMTCLWHRERFGYRLEFN
jgi:hypothetical protein